MVAHTLTLLVGKWYCVNVQEVVYGHRYMMIVYVIMLLFLYFWLSSLMATRQAGISRQNHWDSMSEGEL